LLHSSQFFSEVIPILVHLKFIGNQSGHCIAWKY
jgi:hypothetical protein